VIRASKSFHFLGRYSRMYSIHNPCNIRCPRTTTDIGALVLMDDRTERTTECAWSCMSTRSRALDLLLAVRSPRLSGEIINGLNVSELHATSSAFRNIWLGSLALCPSRYYKMRAKLRRRGREMIVEAKGNPVPRIDENGDHLGKLGRAHERVVLRLHGFRP